MTPSRVNGRGSGPRGEGMVLEMCQPGRILEVAQQMIEISGRTDIEIVRTGLRDADRLHEELFGPAQGRRATNHELKAVPGPPLRVVEVRGSLMRWGEAQGAA